MRRRVVESWHRFYDPSTGRYITADPIGLAGGMNQYAYVGGDPVNWIDPKGLEWFDPYDPNPLDKTHLVPGRTDSHYGAEGHFFLGGGLIALECTDECGIKKTFRFLKICFGGAIGASGGVGLVKGTEGEKCKADSYKGWFYELGGSYGYGSAGVDIGYNSDGPFGLPGSLSGVNEAGVGLGFGAKVKSSWCYYIPL